MMVLPKRSLLDDNEKENLRFDFHPGGCRGAAWEFLQNDTLGWDLLNAGSLTI